MLNSEKMSKSTGNFKTLHQAIEDLFPDAKWSYMAGASDAMDCWQFMCLRLTMLQIYD